jgi:hypothetical protein
LLLLLSLFIIIILWHVDQLLGNDREISMSPPVEEEAPFRNNLKPEKNKNMVMGADGAQYQERQCGR